jgi:hypothetical protein
MLNLNADEPLAVAAKQVIHTGNVAWLARLLAKDPCLATARIDSSEA